jgi:hypothetical protein
MKKMRKSAQRTGGIVKAEGLGDGLLLLLRLSHRQASLDDATHHTQCEDLKNLGRCQRV